MGMRDFPSHIGESIRGLQSQLAMLGAYVEPNDELVGGGYFEEVLGAGAPRGSAVQRLAQAQAMQRLGRHAPTTHLVPSQYKDSNGFGIEVRGVVLAGQFSSAAGAQYPTVPGSTRAFVSIKPQKLILDEDLIFTWENSTGATRTAASVDNAADLMLVSAFVGNKNVFATAPTQSTGFSGRALSNVALGNGISWPTVNPGIDVVVTLGIKPTAQYRSAPPSGYTQADLVSIELIANLNIFGEQLR